MVSRQRQSEITHKGSEMSSFSKCTANLFLEEAPKCSPTSCFRYTVLGNDVQSPIYLDESTRLAPLSKLPCSPWIFQDECQGYGLWETFCIQFCHNSLWESKAAAHNFQPCHYPGSHKQLQPNCSKPFFEISNDLPSIVVILQGTQQHLDTGIVLFELHRVSHKERRVVVSVVKQHGFEALGWTVYE